MLRACCVTVLTIIILLPLAQAAAPLPPIPRLFPPVGMKPDEATTRKLRGLIEELENDLQPFDPRGKDDAARAKPETTLFADVAIYPKAVRFALDYDEFYKPGDVADAEKLLTIGRARLKELQEGVKEPSWTKQKGLVVRGYISIIDDSVQPYGLHIPEDLDLSKKPPLYVWLHGRQEKTLDLQFITERAKSKGKFAADDAITVHPFGRYNNAFKFAGERDVLDVMFHVEKLYKTDPTRRVLMGFSMGGGGAWHIGAHYPNLFRVVAPGAGFSESRKFLRIKDDALPPWYEQKLWAWYDAPDYVTNLFNIPVIAYSGEKDGQKQAADVIEAEFAKHGKKLRHIIGPNMGHDYDKASLETIRNEIKAILATPLPSPDEVTYTVDFYFEGYLDVFGVKDADLHHYATLNDLSLPHPPIDGIFCEPFVFIMPSGTSNSQEVDAWIKRESAYQIDRWRRTMRGDIQICKDTDLTEDIVKKKNLVMWGDRNSNRVIRKYLTLPPAWEPILKNYQSGNFVAAGLIPNDMKGGFKFPDVDVDFFQPKANIVLNSGPTFRDEHDRNNANQTPKLPDWAVIDVTTPGDAKSPGKIVTAGFFDNDWKYIDPAKQKAEFEARQKQK